MNRKIITLVCLISLVLSSFSKRSKNNQDYYETIDFLKDEYKIVPKNATVFLINNGVCKGGFCGHKLNKFLIENVPQHTQDTLIFLVGLLDKNFKDTIQLYSNTVVKVYDRNALHKHGVYSQTYRAIKIKNYKIHKKQILNQHAKFKNWF